MEFTPKFNRLPPVRQFGRTLLTERNPFYRRFKIDYWEVSATES